MTLPRLNGSASIAVSGVSLMGLLTIGGYVISDRMQLGDRLSRQESQIELLAARVLSLEMPGGRTVMAVETRRELDAITRRLERIEARGDR